MLLIAAERTPGLLREPPPFILHKSLDDYAVTYELNVYIDNPSAMYQLYTELHRNILDVFNEHNVQIMTPFYVADPAEPKVVPKDQWFAHAGGPSTSEENRHRLVPSRAKLPRRTCDQSGDRASKRGHLRPPPPTALPGRRAVPAG